MIKKAFMFSAVTAMALFGTGCKRRAAQAPAAPASAEQTEQQPSSPERMPGMEDERKPVSGREEAGVSHELVVDTKAGSAPLADPVLMRDIEERLAAAGYAVGEVDGKADAALHRAVMDFQLNNELPATGRIDLATAEALGLDWGRLAGPFERIEEPPVDEPDPSAKELDDALDDLEDLGEEAGERIEQLGDEVEHQGRKAGQKIQEKAEEIEQDVRD